MFQLHIAAWDKPSPWWTATFALPFLNALDHSPFQKEALWPCCTHKPHQMRGQCLQTNICILDLALSNQVVSKYLTLLPFRLSSGCGEHPRAFHSGNLPPRRVVIVARSLSVWHYFKCFTCGWSTESGSLLSLFCRWEDWGTERWSNLLKDAAEPRQSIAKSMHLSPALQVWANTDVFRGLSCVVSFCVAVKDSGSGSACISPIGAAGNTVREDLSWTCPSWHLCGQSPSPASEALPYLWWKKQCGVAPPAEGRERCAVDWTSFQPLIQEKSVYKVPRAQSWSEMKGWPSNGDGCELRPSAALPGALPGEYKCIWPISDKRPQGNVHSTVGKMDKIEGMMAETPQPCFHTWVFLPKHPLWTAMPFSDKEVS